MSVSGERAVEAGGGAVDRRRRRWSEAQKRQIVAESREPGVSVSVVARRYNVNANQVFTWRRQYCEPEGDAEAGRLVPVGCWAHSRRKFFELADIAASKRRRGNAPPISPLALEAVKRIDPLFDIERGIVGESAEHRLAVRRELSAPVLADLKEWMEAERGKLSKHAPVAKAMDYMLKRWALFARFLDDGRICLTNNAAERALRGIALGRRS